MDVPVELRGLALYEADEKLAGTWVEFYAAMRATYPMLDVMQEVKKAHAWEMAQPPTARKKNRVRFLTTWLAREHTRHVLAKERQALWSNKKPYTPPQASPAASSCATCKGTYMASVKAVNRWGEEYDAMAPCPACRPKKAAGGA